jgi:transposase
MRAYSQDLRQRIVEALEADEKTQPEIADRFGVSVSFVEKLWYRWRKTGSCAALAHGGGPKRALADDQALIRAEIARQPDISLTELCQRVAQSGGANASPSMMCRELKRLKLQRKKSRFTIRSVRLRG